MRSTGPLALLRSRLHLRRYRRSGGRRGAHFRGAPVFCLTVPGRVTGEPRSVLLVLVRRDDDLVVCGAYGRGTATPDWFRNLLAVGEATATVGGDSWLVTARAAQGDEREACWSLLVEAHPGFAARQARVGRPLPVVVLERAVRIGGPITGG